MDAGASSSGAVGFAHVLGGLHAPAQPVGATLVAEGGERAQARPQCIQFVSQQPPKQQLCTQSILDTPNAQPTPTQPQSPSPSTERFFVSSPAVAILNELRAGAEAGGAPDAHMDGILDNEELESVFESVGGAEDSSVKREAQGVLQLATKKRIAGRSKP